MSQDLVEKIGICKTRESMEQSDLILYVVDATQSISEADCVELGKIRHKEVFIVINKIDLVAGISPAHAPNAFKHLKILEISALIGKNIDILKQTIIQHCLHGASANQENSLIPNLRQKLLLEKSEAFLSQALRELGNGTTHELIISDLEAALNALKAITGERADVDILNEIFNQFCIGK
jgi:tRNA modification GTPase